MKVKELIEILSKMNPNATVVIEDEKTQSESTSFTVTNIYGIDSVYISAHNMR